MLVFVVVFVWRLSSTHQLLCVLILNQKCFTSVDSVSDLIFFSCFCCFVLPLFTVIVILFFLSFTSGHCQLTPFQIFCFCLFYLSLWLFIYCEGFYFRTLAFCNQLHLRFCFRFYVALLLKVCVPNYVCPSVKAIFNVPQGFSSSKLRLKSNCVKTWQCGWNLTADWLVSLSDWVLRSWCAKTWQCG